MDDILDFTEKDKLVDFIKHYAQNDAAFNKAFLEKFSPNRQSQKKQEQPSEDYEGLIQSAFVSQSNRRSGRYGYYDDYDDYGFDADQVREQLEALLEKARYYIKYQNIDEAILIAQKMIETNYGAFKNTNKHKTSLITTHNNLTLHLKIGNTLKILR